jgi:HD-like signal output (HDOD) protein/CheY-like chemotaxis protein
MVSVLFVDDNLAGLQALRETYASCSQHWETAFVPSGSAALDVMAERPVDAVVASSRLAGMSAASLLRMTKQHHPKTVRLALSNPGDRGAMLSTLPVATQCLSRACGADVLGKVVARTTKLHEKLFNEATQRMVAKVGALPSLPANLVALDTALSNEDCSLGQIADIMSSDVAMVAKVLQLVNSSFFGLRTKIHDLRQAVAYLGVETLRDFAMAGAVFHAFTPDPRLPGEWLNNFNAHSVAVADIAGHLVRTSLAQCEASVAGMLHGVGDLVVAERAPAKLAVIRSEVLAGAASNDTETNHLGTTYPVIGGYLLAQWGIGYHIVEAVTCQRDIWTGPPRDPELADVLRVADHLAADAEADHSAAEAEAGAGEPGAAEASPDDDARTWVCLSSKAHDTDADYEERVGLLGAVRMYNQALALHR